jgi:diketogulonate reductase-like aldo/keto reductase
MNAVDTIVRPTPVMRSGEAAIPVIGFGTAIGWGGGAAPGTAAEAVANALRAGYRHLDAARKYGTEEEVAEGMRHGGVPRSEIFITTKVSHENLHAGDFRKSAEESLRALAVDYVDLLLIHWPNPNIPLKETLEALAKCKRDGLARHVGVANFTTKLLDKAVALSPEPLVCNQVEFHPYLDQRKVYERCRKHDMVIIGYCPFMRGGEVLNNPVVAELARAKGRTPGQVILRWVSQQEGVGAIPRSTNPERIRQNIDIFDFELTADEMGRISALRSNHKRVANPPHGPVWDTP